MLLLMLCGVDGIQGTTACDEGRCRQPIASPCGLSMMQMVRGMSRKRLAEEMTTEYGSETVMDGNVGQKSGINSTDVAALKCPSREPL